MLSAKTDKEFVEMFLKLNAALCRVTEERFMEKQEGRCFANILVTYWLARSGVGWHSQIQTVT